MAPAREAQGPEAGASQGAQVSFVCDCGQVYTERAAVRECQAANSPTPKNSRVAGACPSNTTTLSTAHSIRAGKSWKYVT